MRLLSSAAVICAALFSGTILHAQDPELLAKRQCRSVHINQQGHPSQASALYNVVKAKTSVPGTYFCAMNFDDGYIGFQEQSNGKKVIIFSIWDPVAHGDNPKDVPDEECTRIYVDVPICAILYEGYKTCLISSGDFIILKPIGQKSFSLKSEYSGVLTYMAKEWEMHGVLFSDTESDLLYIDTSESSIMEYKKWIDELENRRAINKIKEKLLAKKRKQDLEKAALQELMDEGEIFPEANKRPPIPKEVVDVVWRRDGGKCVYCGSTENLQLDHIIPFSKGGATTVENLQLLCQKCNLQKSNKIG